MNGKSCSSPTENESVALYESFWLRHQEALEDFQSSFSRKTASNNKNENKDPTTTTTAEQSKTFQKKAASVITSLAELRGALQYCVIGNEHNKKDDGCCDDDETDSKMAYLSHTLFLLEENSESLLMMQQVQSACNTSLNQENRMSNSKRQQQRNYLPSADVDAFFEEYPDFDKSLCEQQEHDSYNDDDDDYESTSQSSISSVEEKRRKPKRHEAATKQQNEEHIDLLNVDDDDDDRSTKKSVPAAPNSFPQKNYNQIQPPVYDVKRTEDPPRPKSSSSHYSIRCYQRDNFSYSSHSSSHQPPPPQQMDQPTPHMSPQPGQVFIPQQNPQQRHVPTTAVTRTNPYAPPPQQQLRPAPPPPAPAPLPPTWDEYQEQQQNPFQTAAEYANISNNKNAVTQRMNNYHPQVSHTPPPPQIYHYSQPPPLQNHQYQHPPPPPIQPLGAAAAAAPPTYNPYVPPIQPHHEPEILPEKPAIRDSLKRKFQPPKRAAQPATGTENSKNRTTITTSKALDHSKRPLNTSAKSGPMSSQRCETKNSNGGCGEEGGAEDDDEDDLPEELKRFGKDLVEKIESEIMDGGDPITFEHIAGLEDAKQTIQEVICWPMKRPDLFTGLRRGPNALLLYGPPGTGKTLIGKAIAHESGATFFSISSSSLTSKWIGEGEKLVRTMFAVAAYRQPAVVFIDEIDSLLTQRKADENEASRRIKTEFLVQMDGTGTSGQGRVLTIGATNRPQELDEAARRRFVKRLYIPLPNEQDRLALIRILLQSNENVLTQQELAKLAKETERFSGADLKALCSDASYGPIRDLSGAQFSHVGAESLAPISYKHFRQALKSMNSSVSPQDLVQYEEWDKQFGSKRAQALDDDDDDEEEEEDVKACEDQGDSKCVV